VLLSRLGISPPSVDEDLYALHALRLLEWKQQPGWMQGGSSASVSRPATRTSSRISRTSSRISSRNISRTASQVSQSHTRSTQTSVLGDRPRSRRLERPEQVREWLKRTKSSLQRASSESILGISGEVSPEMLQIAEDRLLRRYDDVLGAVNVPDDIIAMARELREATRRAATSIRQRGTASTSSGSALSDYRSGQQLSREEDLLKRGRRLIEAQDWAQADHLLSEAYRLTSEHPGILTALAWARYNNAGLNKPDREGQALELLRAALDRDDSHAEAHYYLARLHQESGNRIAAQTAARRAAKLNPEDARFGKLLETV
jgi:tetratricopeptide (TPR) repeat protein